MNAYTVFFILFSSFLYKISVGRYCISNSKIHVSTLKRPTEKMSQGCLQRNEITASN